MFENHTEYRQGGRRVKLLGDPSTKTERSTPHLQSNAGINFHPEIRYYPSALKIGPYFAAELALIKQKYDSRDTYMSTADLSGHHALITAYETTRRSEYTLYAKAGWICIILKRISFETFAGAGYGYCNTDQQNPISLPKCCPTMNFGYFFRSYSETGFRAYLTAGLRLGVILY